MDTEELRKECDEYLNGWKRAKADLANLQKEHERERKDWVQFASARLLERLLPVLDTLYAAAAHSPDLAETVRKLEDFLGQEGVTEIPAEGGYDHALHEVIGRETRAGAEPDTIVTVAQKGYRLHDRVLRPAKVIIAE